MVSGNASCLGVSLKTPSAAIWYPPQGTPNDSPFYPCLGLGKRPGSAVLNWLPAVRRFRLYMRAELWELALNIRVSGREVNT